MLSQKQLSLFLMISIPSVIMILLFFNQIHVCFIVTILTVPKLLEGLLGVPKYNLAATVTFS